MSIIVNEAEYDVEIAGEKVNINGKSKSLRLGKESDEIVLDDQTFTLDFFQEGDPSLLIVNGMMYQVSRVEQGEVSEHKELKAPMSGQVVQVAVAQGTNVTKGQLLLVLEAMKMENQIKSSISGRVAKVAAFKGQHVKLGDLLLTYE